MVNFVNKNQIALMSHAIGIDGRNRKPYRNYYCNGLDRNNEWENLVNKGFALRRDHGKEMGGYYYHISLAGLFYVLNSRDTFDFDKRIKTLSKLVDLCN